MKKSTKILLYVIDIVIIILITCFFAFEMNPYNWENEAFGFGGLTFLSFLLLINIVY